MDNKDIPQDENIDDTIAIGMHLFADEIVNVVFQRDRENRFITSEEYQTTACNTDIYIAIDRAIDVIKELIVEHVDSTFQDLQQKSGKLRMDMAMMDYGEAFMKNYFDGKDADTEKLLYFSVHTTSVAYKFHLQNVSKMDYCAFMIINNCSCNYDVFNGGLVALRQAANKVVHDAESGQGLPLHFLEVISLEYFDKEVPNTRPNASASDLVQLTSKQTSDYTSAASFVPSDILKSSSSTSTLSSSGEYPESSDSLPEDKA